MTNQPDSKQAALRVRRGAQASWAGSLRNGAGSLSLDSAAASPLQISLNSRKRSGQAPATSPEELLAAAHAATAAATMMAPWDRFSTPDTPKISVKPMAPSAYSALIAKPSMRI